MAEGRARTRTPDAPVRQFEFVERDFERVAGLIQARAGIHLSTHKRDMVYSRLTRRLRAGGFSRFRDYLDALEARGSADEWQAFVNALTTNLTAFFREPHHFDTLTAHLSARGGSPATLWCCAASTGEEAWSMAIAACEAYGTLTPPVRILATDIDTHVLDVAARGIYPVERVAALDNERARTFFQRGSGPHAGKARVRPELAALVDFRPLNLLSDDYALRGGFAAAFCRNVMIYFDKPTQRTVLTRVLPLLEPGGLFFAGHSEIFTHAADLLVPCGRTTYRAAPR